MKKSKIVFLLSILSDSALTCIVNVQGNPFSVYGALALTNLEALANGEGGATGTTTGEYVYYDFNGQRWYGVENEGTGKWFPKFDKCYIQGKWGNHVYCIIGSGNCWNGTSCIH